MDHHPHFLLFQFSGLVKNGSMSSAAGRVDGVATEAAAGAAMGTLDLIGGLPTAIGMVLAWPIANKLGKQRPGHRPVSSPVLGGLVELYRFT